MSDLNNKTINSVMWSGIERFSVQGIQFLLSFVVARQLSPSDYGLMAMLAIFMALAQTFIDSGFSNALIQKQNRTNTDFSTVFYFNIVVGCLLYIILILSSSIISNFYRQPLLTDIIYWVGLNFIVNSFATVQRAKLIINLDFKRQALISLIAVIISGGVAVYMAYNGTGVWTLVVQSLLLNIINTVLLWGSAHWHPSLVFSLKSFKELFGFGSKLLAGGLLHTIYMNLYTLIIGRFFTSADLGYYNRSYTLTQYPSSNIALILSRVLYPIECQMQNDDKKLQEKFYLFIKLTSFVVFPLMIGLSVLAEPFIRIVLTDKWIGAVPFVQIMCFAYMWNPIMQMNWDLLNVKHRSDYSLKSEVIKKVIAFVILFASIPFGIKVMCIGLVLYSFADMFIVTLYTKKILPYISFKKEFIALYPIFFQALFMGACVYLVNILILNEWIRLLGGALLGILVYVGIAFLLKRNELFLIRKIIYDKIKIK